METREDQLNGDMRQQANFMFDFAQIQEPPFNTVQYDPEVGLRPLGMLVTNQPVRNQTQFTENRSMNAPNLDPRTFQGGNALGSLPYGHGRGQVSMTNSLVNIPKPQLIMNNNSVFEEVARQNRQVRISPARLTPAMVGNRVQMVREDDGFVRNPGQLNEPTIMY
tara:strand:- start:3157 stop:3651 length:495 start_codon:yes stop_codon:yes gene_type:complete